VFVYGDLEKAGTFFPRSGGVQTDVARAETLLRAARAFVFDAVGALWESVLAGGTPTLQQPALVPMACRNAAQAAKEVVDLVYSAAGGTAADERAPFAPHLRDVHAAAQDFAFSARHMETAGRILVGIEPGTIRF
jgi:alkylation response protein AidB-like acyl-CoA dehydrogenase